MRDYKFMSASCANCNWVAPKNCSLISKLIDILAIDAKVHCNINTLVTEVISHCWILVSSVFGQTVLQKVHANRRLEPPALEVEYFPKE